MCTHFNEHYYFISDTLIRARYLSNRIEIVEQFDNRFIVYYNLSLVRARVCIHLLTCIHYLQKCNVYSDV